MLTRRTASVRRIKSEPRNEGRLHIYEYVHSSRTVYCTLEVPSAQPTIQIGIHNIIFTYHLGTALSQNLFFKYHY